MRLRLLPFVFAGLTGLGCLLGPLAARGGGKLAAATSAVAKVTASAPNVSLPSKPPTTTSAKPIATSAKPNLPTLPSSTPVSKPPTVVKPPSTGKYAKKGGSYAPPAYIAMVKQWHLSTDGKAPLDAAGRPKLVLYSINRGERVELEASTDAGNFPPEQLDKASYILRSGDGQMHPVDGRLLDIVYDLQKHFKASEVRFVSGYRAPLKRLGSNHGYGRAMDLVIPGTIDEWVASYVRALGFTGAGVYPISGFVHVDVRDRSYYWVDKSGPGSANKTTGILRAEALGNDLKAHQEGRVGPPSPAIGRDVDGALAARVTVVTKSYNAANPPPIEKVGDEGDDEGDVDDDDDETK